MFLFAPNAELLVDKNGIIVKINHQVEKLFGYEREELVGKKVEYLIPERIVHTRLIIDKYLRAPVRREMSESKDFLVKRKDGSEFFIEIGLNPIKLENKIFISASIRDVSARVHLVNKLQQSLTAIKNKNKELEQFTYIAAHDLQEPLNTVTGFVELLNEQYKGRLDKNADKYLQFITKASSRMRFLIRGLLDYARIGRERKLSMVDCNKLVTEIQYDFAFSIAETNTTFIIDKLPQVYGCELELSILFQNLISNAIKFRKEGTAPQIKISSEKEGNYWKFSVQDNGIGLAEEHKKKIFIIYQQLNARTEYKGFGLGLAFCQKIVELHGGKIWVDSVPNKGSTFYFTILNSNNL
ncbi:hypothetical protein Lupro_04020 [Lutibacter profundi]|uniref:histidine kinase n=2 Tax=Lutibacter profundi TaxID=1622118 RepID=A0A0X8G5K2_9FLAO|nr:hypothetical protein Lupro_04020 [Lutibacter profundi]